MFIESTQESFMSIILENLNMYSGLQSACRSFMTTSISDAVSAAFNQVDLTFLRLNNHRKHFCTSGINIFRCLHCIQYFKDLVRKQKGSNL